MSDFGKGLRFGTGFAISWILIIFVIVPALFIGGCGLLLATAGHDTHAPQTPSSVPRAQLAVLERKAMHDVRYAWPHYRPAKARCAFTGIDRGGPDSWEYRCTTTARSPTGKVRRFSESIPCFDAPPYRDTGSCTTIGVTPRLL